MPQKAVLFSRDRRDYRYRIENPYSDTDTWYQYQYRYRLGAFLSPGISPGIDWELFLVPVSVPVSIEGFTVQLSVEMAFYSMKHGKSHIKLNMPSI